MKPWPCWAWAQWHLLRQGASLITLRCFETTPVIVSYVGARASTSASSSAAVNMICCRRKFTPASVVFGSSLNNTEETPVISTSPDLPIVHHDGYESPLPPDHQFKMRKFNKLRDILFHDGVISRKQISSPVHVSKEELQCVHTVDYVDRFFEGRTSEREQRVTGFKWSEGLVSRCRYETGGTILAAEIALERGLACSTGGGTHHAFPSHGAGYCLINDMAVAARQMIGRGKVERVLIVDLDVHQGDGSALIFQGDPSVFTLSVHCGKNYPHRKQTSDSDVVVDVGVGDEEYLKIVQDCLPPILDAFHPGLVLYDAGVDPHKDDALGHLLLTDEGLYKRDHWVINEVLARGIPCATVIGGGYDKDVEKLAARHSIVHRAATKIWKDRVL